MEAPAAPQAVRLRGRCCLSIDRRQCSTWQLPRRLGTPTLPPLPARPTILLCSWGRRTCKPCSTACAPRSATTLPPRSRRRRRCASWRPVPASAPAWRCGASCPAGRLAGALRISHTHAQPTRGWAHSAAGIMPHRALINRPHRRPSRPLTGACFAPDHPPAGDSGQQGCRPLGTLAGSSALQEQLQQVLALAAAGVRALACGCWAARLGSRRPVRRRLETGHSRCLRCCAGCSPMPACTLAGVHSPHARTAARPRISTAKPEPPSDPLVGAGRFQKRRRHTCGGACST